jgi:tRNA (Thr-GGU) A37 N-methylase
MKFLALSLKSLPKSWQQRMSMRFPTISECRFPFAIRSPLRLNPFGTSIVLLVARENPVLRVRCLDGTSLLDLKPDRTLFKPIAPPQVGDLQTG